MSIFSSSRHPSPMVLEHTTTERLTPTQDQVAAAVPRLAAGCQRRNAVRGRLKEIWADEHARWLKRDLSAKQYVYLWVGGIYVHARLGDEAQCILVIIGATPDGKKELVGLTDGVRESALSWKELLLDLKRHGLALVPKLVVADGALGFWKAVGEVWSKVREQRCSVHKTANVLNKLPKSVQPKAKTGRWSMPTGHWRHGRRVRRGPRRNRPLKRPLCAGSGSAPRDSSSGAH
jgi:Transposase, Mutator family